MHIYRLRDHKLLSPQVHFIRWKENETEGIKTGMNRRGARDKHIQNGVNSIGKYTGRRWTGQETGKDRKKNRH